MSHCVCWIYIHAHVADRSTLISHSCRQCVGHTPTLTDTIKKLTQWKMYVHSNAKLMATLSLPLSPSLPKPILKKSVAPRPSSSRSTDEDIQGSKDALIQDLEKKLRSKEARRRNSQVLGSVRVNVQADPLKNPYTLLLNLTGVEHVGP